MNGTAEKKPRSTLFGRKDLLEVYRRAKDFIIRYKLLRMCRFSDENGLKRLTICNLWRIERKTDGALHTFAFDLRNGEWLETDNLDKWPDIPFAPIGEKTRSLDWGFWLCKDALRKALRAAGADDLPETGENGAPSSRVYRALFRKYFGGEVRNRKGVFHRPAHECLHGFRGQSLAGRLVGSFCGPRDAFRLARHGLAQMDRCGLPEICPASSGATEGGRRAPEPPSGSERD